ELGPSWDLELDGPLDHSTLRGDGVVDSVVDGEDLGESGDLEDLEDAALGADEKEVAVVTAEALQAADEHAEAGGIEEVDAFEIDDDAVFAFAHQLDQPLAKARRGVDVDLAANGEDGVPVALCDVETEIHRGASYPCACDENLARARIGTVTTVQAELDD